MELITRWCETDCSVDWEYVVRHLDNNGNWVAEHVFRNYDEAVKHLQINSRR